MTEKFNSYTLFAVQASGIVTVPNEGGEATQEPFTVLMNTVFIADVPAITRADIVRAQEAAAALVPDKLGVEPEQVQVLDVVLTSSMFLGNMTKEMWETDSNVAVTPTNGVEVLTNG